MKKRRNDNAVEYWDSMADIMLALFLCILLIVLLLVLYFVQARPREDHIDDVPGGGAGAYTHLIDVGDDDNDDEHHYDDPEPGDKWLPNVAPAYGGGGGGGGDDGDDGDDGDRGEGGEYEEAPYHSGIDESPGEKSAVFVEVVDGETLLPIARKGISFELYDEERRLQTLNDYYPERAEHTTFQTTELGSFFLPEKIYEGHYALRGLTRVEGYSPVEETAFYLDDYYDWEEPFEVNVRIYPLRSIIRIRLVDRDTGAGIADGSFQIIAAENIVTLDQTVRHHKDELVDTIVTNAEGYAESRELYLGNYLIRQDQVPQFYGRIEEETETKLTEKTSNSDEDVELLRADKTTMVVTVRDALYDNVPVPDAVFTLNGEERQTDSLVSDSSGRIYLTNLRKNTSYRIRQVGTSSDYRIDPVEHGFTVDGNGMIQGSVRQELVIENRMIRTTFLITGTLIGNRVSDIRMVLQDTHGRIVRQWTTSGRDEEITGLEPGDYYLIIAGDEDDAIEIYVGDEASVQVFKYTRWTMLDTGIVLSVAVVLMIAGMIVFVVIRKRKKRAGRGTDIR